MQYASAAYRQRLARAGVVPSMSRRGNCYDNAMMESFWSTLKRELVHRCQFAPRAGARGHLRVDRNLLQPCAAPQRTRLQIPCGL
jgi:transposase InsO family protein